MREARSHRLRRRRLLPRAALVLLFVLDGVAGRAADDRPRDVADTHERLDRIYKRLGIEREEVQRPETKNEGCRCRDEGGRRAGPLPTVRASRTPAMPPFLGYVLIGAVILGMLIPLYLSLRASYKRSSREAEPEPEEEAASAGDAAARGPWVVDLRECRRLFEAGRLPEAFAALHRAFLLGLEEQQHLILDPRTTNWEYVARLASRPQLRQTLSAVTVAAEASVLGARPPTREHYLALEERVAGAAREASA